MAFILPSLLLSLIFISLNTQAIGIGKDGSETSVSCMDFLAVKNFDMSKFSGQWLITETYTETGEDLTRCLGVDFSQASINNTFIMNIFRRSGNRNLSLLKQYVRNRGSEGYLDVLTGNLEADQDFAILQTDYSSSALLLTCQDIDFDGVTELIEINFLSRSRTLPNTVFDDYVAILEGYGIFPEFVAGEQESC